MAIDFVKTIPQALAAIVFFGYYELPVYEAEELRDYVVSDAVIEKYGNAKWAIIDLLNEKYGALLFNKYDLYHWLDKDKDDEVAYFLNEAGSNSLNYSQFLAPYRFHLWLGKRGFVIGIEQKGRGFDAVKVNEEKIQENQGGAFRFFRECKNVVFFDDAGEARIVYLEVKFS
ncbi:MAG: hypothetical protein AABY40_04275 [Nanoarchaeota archaeon]